MKKHITLFVCSFFSYAALAQTSFTTLPIPANNTPVSVKSTSYSGADPATSSGANKTWDYSALSFTIAASTSIAYTDMNNATEASSFPGATYFERSASGAENYYQTTSTKSNLLGTYDPNQGTTIVNTDVETMMTIPFAYGNTQSDTYAGNYTSLGYPVTRTGTVTTTYDAYGTLITPDGSYSNIARLKAVSDETQSTDYGVGSPIVYRFLSTTYSWNYPGEYSFRFAIVTVQTYINGTLYNTSSSALKKELVTTGIFSSSAVTSANVFPQPAKDIVHISANAMEGTYKATVYDINGSIVKGGQSVVALDNTVSMPVNDLKKGIYTVELLNDSQVYRQKLVVE
jgi:hypothetical protein